MNEKAVLYIIVGLPGAGKTTLSKKWKKEGKIKDFCDDYQNNPEKKSKDPRQSPHYRRLIKGLLRGEHWAVNDIRYCDKRERYIFAKAIRQSVPHITLNYIYFENRPDICESNVIIRNAGLQAHQKNLIYYYTDLYRIPKTAKILPIRPA